MYIWSVAWKFFTSLFSCYVVVMGLWSFWFIFVFCGRRKKWKVFDGSNTNNERSNCKNYEEIREVIFFILLYFFFCKFYKSIRCFFFTFFLSSGRGHDERSWYWWVYRFFSLILKWENLTVKFVMNTWRIQECIKVWKLLFFIKIPISSLWAQQMSSPNRRRYICISLFLDTIDLERKNKLGAERKNVDFFFYLLGDPNLFAIISSFFRQSLLVTLLLEAYISTPSSDSWTLRLVDSPNEQWKIILSMKSKLSDLSKRTNLLFRNLERFENISNDEQLVLALGYFSAIKFQWSKLFEVESHRKVFQISFRLVFHHDFYFFIFISKEFLFFYFLFLRWKNHFYARLARFDSVLSSL